jgi:hypothetical protein
VNEMRWLMERAGQRGGTEAVNRAMRSAISKDNWAAYWHHRSLKNDEGYYPAITALRAARLWVPAEKEEKHLTKYLKHPEWLTWEEHVRLLMYAKGCSWSRRRSSRNTGRSRTAFGACRGSSGHGGRRGLNRQNEMTAGPCHGTRR